MSTSKILIVEDDPVFRRVLSFTVAKAGLTVETAIHGEQGFERLMRGGIDFLVTDLQMPICSGIELLDRLEQVQGYNRPSTILCTAKGLEIDCDVLIDQYNLSAIMHKPFSPRKLSEVILQTMRDEQRNATAEQSTGNDSSTVSTPIVALTTQSATSNPPMAGSEGNA
ncbi:MAG: response regulator [Pirellulaceae bacterium]|nr:response regulator [Pirellulaceae bacterium]